MTPLSPARDNITPWSDSYEQELFSNLKIGQDATPNIKDHLVHHIIKTYWDAFYEVGAFCPTIGFKFCIGTGTAQLICCHQPSYCPHESKKVDMQLCLGLFTNAVDLGAHLLASPQSPIRNTSLRLRNLYGGSVGLLQPQLLHPAL